jgi:hypothetical protein
MDPDDVGEAKIYLTFKNTESGELKEYLSPEYPWQDSVWLSEWEFVSQRVDESEMIRTHDLVIEDADGNVFTDLFISNSDYQFYIVAYNLNTTDTESFSRIKELYRRADEEGYSMIVLTSSLPEEVNRFKDEISADPHFDFYYSDDIVLKTMIRSNPGMMLMKDGVVLAKWHYNDLPEYEEIKNEYMKE